MEAKKFLQMGLFVALLIMGTSPAWANTESLMFKKDANLDRFVKGLIIEKIREEKSRSTQKDPSYWQRRSVAYKGGAV